MKTIYVVIDRQPAVITISNEILERIKLLKGSLNSICPPKQEIPIDGWIEKDCQIECHLGKPFHREFLDDPGTLHPFPSDDGPVLVYGGSACSDNNRRRINSFVLIEISKNQCFLSGIDYGDIVNLTDHKPIEVLDDVTFSRDFIGLFVSPLSLEQRNNMNEIIKDMPNNHRKTLHKLSQRSV